MDWGSSDTTEICTATVAISAMSCDETLLLPGFRYRVPTRDGGKSACRHRKLSTRYRRKSICDIYEPYAGSAPYKADDSPITIIFVVTGIVVWMIYFRLLVIGATKTAEGQSPHVSVGVAAFVAGAQLRARTVSNSVRRPLPKPARSSAQNVNPHIRTARSISVRWARTVDT